MKVNQILFIIFMILNAVIPYKIRGLSGDKHVSYKNEQDTRKEKRLEDIHLSRNNQSQQASSVAMDQPNLTPFCHQHDEAVHIELPESNFPTRRLVEESERLLFRHTKRSLPGSVRG
ncbi:uncharacterized protein [Montipora foliosa]|uniref:uncharacterized protein n=1 Tax=Montipora foliosa TaxID=591990 RepID=UPI0035F11840